MTASLSRASPPLALADDRAASAPYDGTTAAQPTRKRAAGLADRALSQPDGRNSEAAASQAITVHGTAIAWLGKGVLLLGPSGSGKSDLALRSIDAGATLVADDLVRLQAVGQRLVARAPSSPGLIELRGLGIFRQRALGQAGIDLVVRLAPRADATERLPPTEQCVLAGVTLPVFDLDPGIASAVARLRLLATAERVF